MNGTDCFHIRPRIFSGKNSLARLGEFRGKRVGVVTDAFMVSSGMLDMVLGHLGGSELKIFSGVQPDPTVEVVIRGTKAIASLHPDVVLAVGGGSTIDTAKAIMASLREMQDGARMTLVAVPTTSGTGSEATEFAFISDASKGVKFPLRAESLTPDVAILAPELVKSVPPKVTADTGMDVITHCIEAYVSIRATDFSDALTEKALAMAFKWLPRAYDDGSCILAREKMHNASCMAGMAFNTAGLGLNHGIAHAVGSTMHIAHGRINAMLLAHVIEFNTGISEGNSPSDFNDSIAKRYAALARMLGEDASTSRAGVKSLVGMVRQLNRQLGIPATLAELGADLDEYDRARGKMVRAALDDITTTCNPRQPRVRDVKGILGRLKR